MVDGTGLENRRGVKATEGSNPSLSATKKADISVCFFREICQLNVCTASARATGKAVEHEVDDSVCQ